MALRKTTGLGAVLLLTALAALGNAAGSTCPNPQSPRNLDRNTHPSPYDGTSTVSIVKVLGPDSIEYTPRAGGAPTVLHRCGQHYHYPIEDPQGCSGELPPTGRPGTMPPSGQWVEVHTVFASRVSAHCTEPETLKCCEAGPFLVRAFNAKVTGSGQPGPILPPPGRPLAEWSGSTTGPDVTPNECKPAAQWSFRLSCEFTVSEAQLRQFHHTDKARDLQTGARLSKDLTLVQ